MRARRPSARRAAQVRVSGESDEVIANRDSIARWIGDFDDRSPVRPALILLAQINLDAWWRNRAPVGVDCNPDQRSLELFAIRVWCGNDGHLEAVEDDAGPDRVDADQIDQSLHQHAVVAPVRILPHFPEHLVGLDGHRLIDPASGSRIKAVCYRNDTG